MSEKRTPIGKFIKYSWTNLNIRAGKYKHLQTKNKCKVYENISIEFTREEYKNWCYNNKELILSLKRPSLDRKDSNKNYSLDNIQVIELLENIKKKKSGNNYLNGPKKNVKRGTRFVCNCWISRISINKKEIYLGSFNNKEEAEQAFYNAYLNHYNKTPW